MQWVLLFIDCLCKDCWIFLVCFSYRYVFGQFFKYCKFFVFFVFLNLAVCFCSCFIKNSVICFFQLSIWVWWGVVIFIFVVVVGWYFILGICLQQFMLLLFGMSRFLKIDKFGEKGCKQRNRFKEFIECYFWIFILIFQIIFKIGIENSWVFFRLRRRMIKDIIGGSKYLRIGYN